MSRRASFREIIPDCLYQRGSFLTWPRKQKERLLDEYKINLVINLWTKPDSEVSEDSYRLYFHIPMKSSINNPELLRSITSLLVTNMRLGLRVLVHCEAGVNRSVFFSSLLVAELKQMSGEEALAYVAERCSRTKVHRVLKKYLFEAYP